MASFSACALFLFASIGFLSNVFALQETDKLSMTDDDSYDPTAEEMLSDVTAGTTPAVCPYDQTCAFRIIDTPQTGFHHHKLVRYCPCPEGEVCLEVAKNRRGTYYYYKCFPSGDPKTTTASLAESTTASLAESTTAESTTASLAESTTASLAESTTEVDDTVVETIPYVVWEYDSEPENAGPSTLEKKYGFHHEL